MLRGILLGLGWGVLVAAIGVTTVSLVYSKANRAQMADATVEPAAAENETETVATDTAQADTGETVAVARAPAVGTPEAPAQGATQQAPIEEETSVPTADTTQVPTQAPASPAMSASEEPPANSDAATAQAPDVTIPNEVNSDSGATGNGANSPAIGASDTPVSPDTNSAQLDAPQSESQPQADTQAGAMTAPPMQEAPSEGDVAQTETGINTDAPDVQVAALPDANAPEQAESPQTDATVPAPLPADPPVSQTPTESVPDAAEPVEPATDGRFDTARVPVPKITNLAPNVKTNRLPTIGGDTEVAEADTDAADVVQDGANGAARGALASHAMTFENPDAKPMFSVVLIDDPQHPVNDEVLSHLPFALSFAIDAARDDAHTVAARYRAAGFEVLMLTNLPFGASATDIEVAFGAYSRAIPDAVAVLDLGANGFLRGPSTATQIAGIMSDQGYGLITPSKGLNSAQKAAMREGVPAVLLFRELDQDGEKPSVIRRYLDRAAFRAAQEGSVIMLGHTRPDTIEALVTWALEDRAASVAIAPVSAVLLAQ